MIYIILAIKFLPLQTLFPHNRIELKKVELLGGELKYFFNSGVDYVKIQLYITFNSTFSVYHNIILLVLLIIRYWALLQERLPI